MQATGLSCMQTEAIFAQAMLAQARGLTGAVVARLRCVTMLLGYVVRWRGAFDGMPHKHSASKLECCHRRRGEWRGHVRPLRRGRRDIEVPGFLAE